MQLLVRLKFAIGKTFVERRLHSVTFFIKSLVDRKLKLQIKIAYIHLQAYILALLIPGRIFNDMQCVCKNSVLDFVSLNE